jgi:hypothetical protein
MLDVWTGSKGTVNLTPVWSHAGAPVNGTSGTFANIAAVGDLLVDSTNALLYQNTGTSASPTWTAAPLTGAAAVTSGTIAGVSSIALAAGGFFDNSVSIGLTSVGTNRATALALTSAINQVTAGASTTGVTLPASATVGVGGTVRVINDNGANAFHVYAAGSDTIDGTAGSTGVNLTNAFFCDYLLGSAGAFISFRTAFARST